MAGYTSTYQLAVDIKARGEDRLKEVQKQFRTTGAAAKQAADNINKAFSVLKIGAAVAAVGMLAKKFDDLYNAGDRLGAISTNFARITKDAEGSLATLRAGAMGSVKDEDLMALSNKMSGLGLTAAQTAKIINDGMRIAEASGADLLPTIEAVGRAVATGRATALAQLGVVVDTKAAYTEYAATLGKTAEQLTATDKLNARLAATGTAVGKAFGDVDMANAVGEYEKLRVQVQNSLAQMTQSAATFGDAMALAIRGFGMDKAKTEAKQLGDIMGERADKMIQAAGESGAAVRAALADSFGQMKQGFGAFAADSEVIASKAGKAAALTADQTADLLAFIQSARREMAATPGMDAMVQSKAIDDMERSVRNLATARAGVAAQEERSTRILQEQEAIAARQKKAADDAAFSKRFAAEVEESLKRKAAERLGTEKAIASAFADMARTGIQIELNSGRITAAEAQRRTVALDIEQALQGQSNIMGRMAAVARVLTTEAARQAKVQADAKTKDNEDAQAKAEARRAAAKSAAEQAKAEAQAVRDRIAALDRQLAEERINDQERRKILTASEAAQARHNLRTKTLFAEKTSDQEKALGYQIEDLKYSSEFVAAIEQEAAVKQAERDRDKDNRRKANEKAQREANRRAEEDARRAAENERYINQIRSQNALHAAMALQGAGDMAGSAAGRVAAAFVQTNEATEQYSEAQKQGDEAAKSAVPGLISASGAVTAVLLKNTRAIAWVRAAFEAAAALASAAVGDIKGAALHGAAAVMFGIAAGRSTPKASGASTSMPTASATAGSLNKQNGTTVINYHDNATVRIGKLTEAGEIMGKALNLAGQKGMKISPKLIPAHGGYGA